MTIRTQPAQARNRWVPAEEGLWVFILGDMTVFALFFGVVVVDRGRQPEIFAASQRHLHPGLGLLNTFLLLIGSYLVVLGVRAARQGSEQAVRYFGATIACGLGFAAVKVTEYTLLLSGGIRPGDNTFFVDYFVFTLIHLIHLAIGVALMIALTLVSRQPSTDRGRVRLIEAGGVYWHMVDLLWLVLFPLLYLIS